MLFIRKTSVERHTFQMSVLKFTNIVCKLYSLCCYYSLSLTDHSVIVHQMKYAKMLKSD